MRSRTPLHLLVSAVTVVTVIVAGTLAATAQDSTGDSAPGSAAPAATPLSVVDSCAPVAPPRVTCFAKVVQRPGALTTAADPAGLTPADLISAYDFPAGGSGRTVAIVGAFGNPNLEADLAVYRSTHGLPPCTVADGCLRIVNQEGKAAPLPEPEAGWALEYSLDADMVSAVCPACNILVVQASSDQLTDMGTAVSMAVTLKADVVSNSYGTGVEFAAELDYESHYVHPGTPIVVSAGDIGYSVSWPAASSHVVAVGGTSLTKTADGDWTESVWSRTGSGCSAYVAKPAWQDDPHCPTRMLNDVSAVADPATGVAVYDTFTNEGWTIAGGTSAAAPIIAAAYALTGDAVKRVKGGSTPWLQHKAGGFRDVTDGSNVPGPNAVTCGDDYPCTGVPGYDGPSGWGTPAGVAGLTAP